jgi:phosphatidylethanolamine/phosphatidyl-N-methylethanolamine N-methyltransferase
MDRTLAKPVGLDQASIVDAYRRWAGIYDKVFGGISSKGRLKAVSVVNSLPGRDVLEVGVGTGLALPHYKRDKRIVGIDLSADMLDLARQRVRDDSIGNVRALLEMDAEATSFADASFDIAVGMFVASVVPDARRLLSEMRRVVRPGGHILFVNHFAAKQGPRRWVERAMAPASRALGWHPDFAMEALFSTADMTRIKTEPVPPFGLFTLVRLES